ncbi:MAG: CPBP family glutamic-type intramembrane protease [Candidatus Heimdallarchaeota archaeon]
MSEENNDQNNEKGTEEITCIKCGAKNPKQNLFCTICGYNFVEKVKCLKCSGLVPAFNTFCNHCGASMKTDQTIASKRPVRIVTEIPQQQKPPSPIFGQQRQQQQQFGYQAQMRPMTEEEASRYQEQLKAQQLYSRNRTAMYFGIVLIAVALFNFGTFFFVIFAQGSELAETALSLYGISFDDFTPGQLYGSLISTYILQGAVALALGISLIVYKPDNNAWKGFSKAIRYVFLGVVSLIALLIIFMLIFWFFYNPRYNITGELPFWIFTIVGIPVNMPVMLLSGILLLVYFICIGMLVGPSIYNFVKDRKKKAEGVPEVIIEDTPTTIGMKEGVSFSPLIAYSEVEKRKVRMPDMFYRIKNSSFIKTFEHLGLMYIVSFIVVIIATFLGAIPETDLNPVGESSQEVLFISATWAGISEEIVFRILLIGVPMIAVVAIRYFIETGKISMPSYKKQVQGTSFFKIESRVARIDEKLELTKWDIALAIRGKYKRIGYPEWIVIGISSIFFGMAHWSGWTGSWAPWKIFHAGAIGLFLGYVFVKYGIEAAIVLHFTNNVIAAIQEISVDAGFEGMVGLTSFIVTSFTLLGMMKIFSEGLNLMSKFRMRREEILLKRYQ